MEQMTFEKVRDQFAYEIPGLEGENDAVRKQWNSLKYIDHLAAQTKTVIDGWDVNMFRRNGRIETDRSKINEIFFKFRESLPTEKLQAKSIVDAAVADKLQGLIRTIVNYSKGRVRQDERQAAEKVSHVAAELQQAKQDLVLRRISMDAVDQSLKANSTKIYEQVKNILSSGFYTLGTNHPQNGVEFITDEITLSYMNQGHGINHVVPMGRYRVVMTINRYGAIQVKVRYWDRNPVFDGYYHPHVSGGDVCWGNMTRTFHQASARVQFDSVATVVQDVLKIYNDDNPYVGLQHFVQAYKDENITKLGRFPEDPPEDDENDELDNDENQPNYDEAQVEDPF